MGPSALPARPREHVNSLQFACRDVSVVKRDAGRLWHRGRLVTWLYGLSGRDLLKVPAERRRSVHESHMRALQLDRRVGLAEILESLFYWPALRTCRDPRQVGSRALHGPGGL